MAWGRGESINAIGAQAASAAPSRGGRKSRSRGMLSGSAKDAGKHRGPVSKREAAEIRSRGGEVKNGVVTKAPRR